jgi:hypothetical protein
MIFAAVAAVMVDHDVAGEVREIRPVVVLARVRAPRVVRERAHEHFLDGVGVIGRVRLCVNHGCSSTQTPRAQAHRASIGTPLLAAAANLGRAVHLRSRPWTRVRRALGAAPAAVRRGMHVAQRPAELQRAAGSMPKSSSATVGSATTVPARPRRLPLAVLAAVLLASALSALLGPRHFANDRQPDAVERAAEQQPGADFADSTRAHAITASKPRTRSALGPEGAAQAALTSLGTRFHAALDADPFYQRYQKCIEAGTDASACRPDLDAALYAAIAGALDPFVGDEAQQLLLDWPDDSERIARQLRDRLAAVGEHAAGPADTLVTLALLQLVRPDDAFPLPPAAYRDLAERTQPETQLLLNGHRGPAPLPSPELQATALALALDEARPGRIRVAAVAALGHAADHAQLAGLVEAVRGGGESAKLFGIEALPGALVRCGATCAGLVDALAAQPAAEARRIAYRSLSFLPPGQAAARKRQLEQLSPESLEITQLQMRAAETSFRSVD